MAEPHPQGHGSEAVTKRPVETTDRGMFDCFGKKEEKPGEDVAMIELETVQVSEADKMKEKHTLMEELHRSHSNSSSSSDDEEGGEKKRKKKGLKEEIKKKTSSKKEEQVKGHKDTSGTLENCNEVGNAEATLQEEKKDFLEKIKEKLPGQHKKAEEGNPAAPPPECAADGNSPRSETKDKKGILEKIKEKLPGYHKNDDDNVKEKEN
ncbi:Dehydrin COR47 [Camellia lanceoleosa]|uniref:Dehydrin COR47 n=1 Tax=Camellia lanceoleosa TaxID=1840588 RepID=A0ACC0IIR6_9ERIC|nr:Dehydrin COR47 [Camellia lanceoleosa]